MIHSLIPSPSHPSVLLLSVLTHITHISIASDKRWDGKDWERDYMVHPPGGDPSCALSRTGAILYLGKELACSSIKHL